MERRPFSTTLGQVWQNFSNTYHHSYTMPVSWSILKSARIIGIDSIELNAIVRDAQIRSPLTLQGYGAIDFSNVTNGVASALGISGNFVPVEVLYFGIGLRYYNDFWFRVTNYGSVVSCQVDFSVQNTYGFLADAPITFYQEARVWNISWQILVQGWYSYTD